MSLLPNCSGLSCDSSRSDNTVDVNNSEKLCELKCIPERETLGRETSSSKYLNGRVKPNVFCAKMSEFTCNGYMTWCRSLKLKK